MLKHIKTRKKKLKKGKEDFKTNTSKKSSSSLIFDCSPLSNLFTNQ